MNKNNQISKNFTVEEFTYSRKAIENGIDNMPGESQIAAIRLLITQLIQPLRDRRLLRRLRPGAIAGSIDR